MLDRLRRATPLGLCLILAGGKISAQARNCDGFITPLVVPSGHCVRLLADSLGPVRHIIIHPSGWIVVALNKEPGLVRFKDTNGDGRIDQIVRFGPGLPGTGLVWRAGWLYFAADNQL